MKKLFVVIITVLMLFSASFATDYNASGYSIGEQGGFQIWGNMPACGYVMRITSVTTTTTVFRAETFRSIGSPLAAITLDDMFNAGWYILGLQMTGATNEGLYRDITDFTSATGEFTTAAMLTTYAIGDLVGLVPEYLITGRTEIEAVALTTASISGNTQVDSSLVYTNNNSFPVMIDEIVVVTVTADLVGPTNLELSTNNVQGLTGTAAPLYLDALAAFDASQTVVFGTVGDTKIFPFQLEAGKKLWFYGDDARGSAGTWAATMYIYIRYAP